MVRNMDVLCIIALHLQFSWQNACNNRCNGFLLSMSPLTHHTHQQSVCVLSHPWCHINSYLMQLFSLFLMKSIVFAILLCHICSDTYSDREGRYSRCLQMIAKITSLKEILWFVCFLKPHLRIMITVRTYRIIYFRAQWSGVGAGVCYSAQMETRWILGPMAAFVTDLDKSWGYPCAFGVLAVPEQPLCYFLRAAVARQQLAEGCAVHAFNRWGKEEIAPRVFSRKEGVRHGAHTSGQELILHHIIELNNPWASDVVLSGGVCA